ncbi:hypothetical protein Cni_G16510 [Canna indica]|uniref:Glycosyltransferase 2-like domain-containing protein n=1 Tax=Canna indica TaxID=4628 RepID=A0AAQ3KGL8_9LILI|nr:hypothetical protein Cni_G16510 [Canna indica]
MKHNYVKECEYLAIFDADFQQQPDLIPPSIRTIPFLIHNPKIGLVQGRWTFKGAPRRRPSRGHATALRAPTWFGCDHAKKEVVALRLRTLFRHLRDWSWVLVPQSSEAQPSSESLPSPLLVLDSDCF